MEWNIFGIMDGILEKAKTKCWSNYKQILNEYTLFSEAEKTDREEVWLKKTASEADLEEEAPEEVTLTNADKKRIRVGVEWGMNV